MSIYDAVHRFEPDDNGQCQGGWLNNASDWVTCGSRQRSSTLHDDPDADFRERHDHGGGDCMCFEDENGPSYYQALEEYRQERMRDDPSLREYYRTMDR